MIINQRETAVAPYLTDRHQQIRALDDLFARSAKYTTGADYLELLSFINRFPRLSPYNAFLIRTQNAGVRVVATAAEWRAKHGRPVRPLARPLVTLRRFGPVSFVYDISDTDGPPLPPALDRPFETRGVLSERILKRTIRGAQKDHLEIIESQLHRAAAGYAQRRSSDFRVVLNSLWDLKVKYSTLVHELGHIYCGHVGSSPSHWWPDRGGIATASKEIEAESISFLVCKRRGLETSSEEYLAAYTGPAGELPPLSLESVLTVAGYVEMIGDRLQGGRNHLGLKDQPEHGSVPP